MCFTFGWPYCIERGCHENFLSCGGSVASLASTNAVDADYHLSCVCVLHCVLWTRVRVSYAMCVCCWSADRKQPLPPSARSYIQKIQKRKYSPHFDMHVDLFIYLPTFVWFLARANSIVVHTANAFTECIWSECDGAFYRNQFTIHMSHSSHCRTKYSSLFGKSILVRCPCISRWREQSSVCIPIQLECMRYQHTTCFRLSLAGARTHANTHRHGEREIDQTLVCVVNTSFSVWIFSNSSRSNRTTQVAQAEVCPFSAELRSVLCANNRYTVAVSPLFTFNTGYLIRLHNVPFIGNAMAI